MIEQLPGVLVTAIVSFAGAVGAIYFKEWLDKKKPTQRFVDSRHDTGVEIFRLANELASHVQDHKLSLQIHVPDSEYHIELSAKTSTFSSFYNSRRPLVGKGAYSACQRLVIAAHEFSSSIWLGDFVLEGEAAQHDYQRVVYKKLHAAQEAFYSLLDALQTELSADIRGSG